MRVGRSLARLGSREQREEEVEDLVTVREGECRVNDGLHGVREEGWVVGLIIDLGDDVQTVRLKRDANSLRSR